MRVHRLLGGRRLSWTRRRCYRQLRRSELPRADHRSVGGVTPPLALLAYRHAAQAHGEAGVTPAVGHVRFVPKADILHCGGWRYSMTSSAVASSDGGTAIPSAFAVFRLITNSNLVGCSTGRSAGLVPLSILSTYSAVRRNMAVKLGP